MFSDVKAREAVATVQDEAARLRDQLAAAHEQLTVTRDQVTALAGQVATLRDQLPPLRSEVAALRGEVAMLTGRCDEHEGAQRDAQDRAAGRTAQLGDELVGQGGRLDRLGADIARLERQATIDMDEMRANYAAIAEIIVRSRSSASDDDLAAPRAG